MREPHLKRRGEAYVADDATIWGAVRLGRDASIWYGCVVRADVASIAIGDRTNLQDLSVVHPQHDEDIHIGADCVIGHHVTVHGRRVGDRVLIGMGSILMPGSVVEDDAIIGAGSLVPIGMVVPQGMLAIGSPARIVRAVKDGERTMIHETVQRYLELIPRHAKP